MEDRETKAEPAVYRISWALLGEWYCVDMNADPDEVAKIIEESSHAGLLVLGPELVKDRLYGGFGCANKNRRHVHYATGQYTYLDTNHPLETEQRLGHWSEILNASPDPKKGGFIGGGPFCEDAPV